MTFGACALNVIFYTLLASLRLVPFLHRLVGITLTNKKTLIAVINVFVAPPVGLEPTTLRLTAACSTD